VLLFVWKPYGCVRKTLSPAILFKVLEESLVETDRWMPSSLGVRNINAVRISAAILIVVTLVAAMMALQLGQSPDTLPRESPARIEYTSHPPILINNNSDLVKMASLEGWNGTGSAAYPYKITDYDIDGSTMLASIYIGNTTAHFIVTGCNLHGTHHATTNSGIYLCNVTNGVIADNNCSDNYYGIELGSSSHNNVVRNNTCVNNWHGIILHSDSNNNTLMNNTCLLSSMRGIVITFSNDNVVSKNNCSSNYNDGIFISNSINMMVVDNIFYNNSIGISLDGNNQSVRNNTCYQNLEGIQSGTTFSLFIGNNVSENQDNGLYLSSGAHSNNVENNVFYINSGYGISSWPGATNNRIWNNSLIKNNGSTAIYDPSHIQAHDNGTDNWWNSIDGYGNYWSDWQGRDFNMDGVQDAPYNISGTAGAKDYYPLASFPTPPIPEFSNMIIPMIGILSLFVLVRARRNRK